MVNPTVTNPASTTANAPHRSILVLELRAKEGVRARLGHRC